MVSLEDNLLPWQVVDKLEIRQRFLQRHAPGYVTTKNRPVFFSHDGMKTFADFIHVILPSSPENIHWFFASQRQMQISNCE
jgi:hypothetical protein